MSGSGKIAELRRRYLQRLYERSKGDVNEGVNEDELLADLGVGEEEGDKLFSYLSSKGLVRGFTFGHIAITDRGLDEAERAMKSNFAENERRVLRRLYDQRERRHMNPHTPEELARDLNLDVDEVYDIVNELGGQGLISGTDEASWITPAGIKHVESGGERAGSATPAVSFTTNIHGPNYGGIQQGGQNNVQNVTLTNNNNPDFERTLASLVELLRASGISQLDKDEIIHDVERFKQLAQQKDNPGALERAQKKLEAVKTGIEVADSGGELMGKALPYITSLWQFLTALNS